MQPNKETTVVGKRRKVGVTFFNIYVNCFLLYPHLVVFRLVEPAFHFSLIILQVAGSHGGSHSKIVLRSSVRTEPPPTSRTLDMGGGTITRGLCSATGGCNQPKEVGSAICCKSATAPGGLQAVVSALAEEQQAMAGSPVTLCCPSGKNCSAAVHVCYLVKHKHWSFLDALNSCKHEGGDVKFNEHTIKAVKIFLQLSCENDIAALNVASCF